MMNSETKITTDRECDLCGYNLKGLPNVGKCPECGTPIRRRDKTSGFITDEAPTWYVKKLRLGFLAASCSIVGSIFISVFFSRLEMLFPGLAVLWWVGIYFITSPRPGRGAIRPDKVLDNPKLRLSIQALNAAWACSATISVIISVLGSVPNGRFAGVIGVLMFFQIMLSVVAWLSMIPTSVYLAELAYWAAHNSLAQQMRGAAWILAVIGSFTVLMTGTGAALGSPLILTLTFFPWVIIAITVLFYNVAFIRMTMVMHHVVEHQRLAAGSFERVEERRKRDEKYGGRIVDDTPCPACGYNLVGLEQGGYCPECGESFASVSPMSIRDPARTPSYHDNSDLEVSEGEDKGVFFNDQLDAFGKPKVGGVAYTPATEVPEDGDIPLSHEDGESKPITHENLAKENPKPRDDNNDGLTPISI